MSSSSLYTTTPETGTVSSSNLTTLYSNTTDFTTGIVNSSVYSVNAGAGITVNPTTGNVVVTNTGVLSVIAGSGIAVSGSTGNVTISSTTAGTTYAIDASTTTGGANFNLVGSDSTTDTIKFASGTGITVSRTDANTITITNSDPGSTGVTSITGTANQVIASASTGAVTLSTPQNIATTSSPTFASMTLSGDIAVNGGDITTTATTASVFNTTATTLNIGGAASSIVNIGSSSSNVYAKGNTILGTDFSDDHYLYGQLNFYGRKLDTSSEFITSQQKAYMLVTSTTAANQNIFIVTGNGFGANDWSGGKFVIQASSGSDFHIVELLVLVQASTDSTWVTQYAELYSSTPLATFGAERVSTGTWRINATPVNAVTTFKTHGTLMASATF